jgi:hypothetical protein
LAAGIAINEVMNAPQTNLLQASRFDLFPTALPFLLGLLFMVAILYSNLVTRLFMPAPGLSGANGYRILAGQVRDLSPVAVFGLISR